MTHYRFERRGEQSGKEISSAEEEGAVGGGGEGALVVGD